MGFMNFLLILLFASWFGIIPRTYPCNKSLKNELHSPLKSKSIKIFYIPFSIETDFAITAEQFGLCGGDDSKVVGDISWIVEACQSAPLGGHFSNMLVRLKIVPCSGKTIVVEKDGTVFYNHRSRKLSHKMSMRIDSYLTHRTRWDLRAK